MKGGTAGEDGEGDEQEEGDAEGGEFHGGPHGIPDNPSGVSQLARHDDRGSGAVPLGL